MKWAMLYSASSTSHILIAHLEQRYGRAFKTRQKHSYWKTLGRVLSRRNASLLSKLNTFLFYIYYPFVTRYHARPRTRIRPIPNPQFVPDLVIDDINDERAVAALREVAPDIVVVFATTILGQEWLNLDIPMTNVHLGILPRYRGHYSWLWALVDDNFDALGVSVHLVSERVDSGRLVSQKHIDPAQLGGHINASIASEMIPLMCASAEEAVAAVMSNRIPEDLPANHARFRAYLEPGLTDYLKFVKNYRTFVRLQESNLAG